MKKNLTKIVMLALCLCMMVAMFVTVASATEATEPVEKKDFVVTLDKYYDFYNGMEQTAPVLTVADEDGKALDKNDYTVTWVYKYKSSSTPVESFDTFKKAGAYFVTVELKDDTGYEVGSKTVFFSILNFESDNVNAQLNAVCPSIEYGKKVVYSHALGYKNNEYHREVEIFREKNEDGTFTVLDKAPTEVGTYEYYVIDFGYYYYVSSSVIFEITPKKVTIVIEDAEKTYGENDPAFTYEENKFVVGDDDVTVTPYRAVTGETVNYLVGDNYYKITAKVTGADADKYEIEIVDNYLTIKQRELHISDFVYDDELDYTGKVQVPVLSIDTHDGKYKAENVDLQVIGGRKYSGKYEAKIVALYDENYVLADEIVLPYEIVGGTDKDAVVEDVADKFDFIKVSAPAIAPVVETIVKNIWTGVKAGVSALLKDFVSRVFA